MHPLEVELAELMRACIPHAEAVRFSKTGADVTSAAVRLARAYTGRVKVLCCGYHGWHDWYIGVTDRNAGVPSASAALTRAFTYNDIDSAIGVIDGDTACVILEPFVFERPQPGFLAELRRACDRHGALLVFDEMWTGFRCALGGAQELFSVRADLCLYSKAMANGMPISAITGHREVMALLEEEVFFFTTFGGETLSLAAALACIGFIRDHGVVAHLARLGQRLCDGLKRTLAELSIEFVSVAGYPFRSVLNFAPSAGDPLAQKTLVQQELLRRGVLWSGTHTLCAAHTEEEIDYTLRAYAAVLPILKEAVQAGDLRARLRGGLVRPVFRRIGHPEGTRKAG
jgi:glutamate-1-semialdehyde aminotransferase